MKLGVCIHAQVCARAGVCCFVGANRCIPLTLLVDVCQYCHFLKCFSGLSLLEKMVNKESEAEAKSRSSKYFNCPSQGNSAII